MQTVRTGHVASKDGTTIGYERSGSGPALILIDGALCSRAFGPSAKLAPLLARHFTVYTYDRRGRGQSGDTPPYAPAREVEDLAAIIREAKASPCLLGLSSGAALALEAAASGLPVSKVVAYEPPYVDDRGERGGAGARRSTRAPAGRGESRRGREIFHEGHGRRAGADRRDAAPDAVDLAQAGGRRPHAALRREHHDAVQDSAGAFRVHPGAGPHDERREDRSAAA